MWAAAAAVWPVWSLLLGAMSEYANRLCETRGLFVAAIQGL